MLKINTASLDAFITHLKEQEYSPATITKYAHDLHMLLRYAPEGIADKEQLNGFRAYLEEQGYSGASVNSMLGAVNCFLAFLGSDWRLRYVRVQRRAFLPADRELSKPEYERLVSAALRQGDRRLALIVQTLCALGLRVSELKAVTVESFAAGETSIHNKGKLRTILIPDALCRKLRAWCGERGIREGCVFVTRTGRALDRSNVWKMLNGWRRRQRYSKRRSFPTISATSSPAHIMRSSRTLCVSRTFSATAALTPPASTRCEVEKKRGGSSVSSASSYEIKLTKHGAKGKMNTTSQEATGEIRAKGMRC